MSNGYIATNNQKLYYELHGHGEPFLMICGLGMDLTGYMLQVPVFSKDFQVIVFDNRDVGRSSKAKGHYSIADMADDTAGLIESLGLGSAHVFGGSMGGAIAQELALRSPDKVRKLILCATIGKSTRHMALLVEVLKFIKEHDHSNEVFPRMALLTGMTTNFLSNDQTVDQAFSMFQNQPFPQSFEAFARQADAVSDFDALDRLHSVKAPTLVLAADQDILTPVSAARKIAAAIPGAQLQILEGGGHGFIWEIPDKVHQAVMEFLRA
jgi:3-oxoadipate enol-lactonase